MSNQTEAPVSVTVKLYSAKGADIMLTVRSGANKEDVEATLDAMVHGIGYAVKQYNMTTERPAVSQPAPQATHAPGIHGLTFEAERMVKSMNNGKTYWKVQGFPFKEYGVTIWPEVLQASGFDPDNLPNDEYALTGYTAHYIEKDGKPSKVTQLVAPAGGTPPPPESPPAPEAPPAPVEAPQF